MLKHLLFYQVIGYLAALVSAFSWALSSILFRRLGEGVPPIGMNLGKCIIGMLYLGIILLLIGAEPVNHRTLLLLGISGLLGIAFGDTFFFRALIYLGPKLAMLLGTLGPVFTVILAVIFLRERPSLLTWLGISLTTGGVTWVLWEYSPDSKTEKNRIRGVKYALASVLCTSIGIILAKIGVISLSALQATFIRISWGAIGLLLWGTASRQLKKWVIPFQDARLLRLIFIAVFIAIFGGFYLFIVALKYSDAASVTILNSTTPLFILPLAAFISKEKVSVREVIGATIAVSGIVLIFAA